MQTSFDDVKDSSLSLFFVLLLVTIPFVWSVLPHNVLVLVLLMLMYLAYDCAYGNCVKRKEEEGTMYNVLGWASVVGAEGAEVYT
jgi:heme O synthase-like polyprenyltransferase